MIIGAGLWSYPQYPINQISVNEGLSHSDVRNLAQDKSGFVWMGTNNGLNRFDGYDVRVYKTDLNGKNSLPNNRIRSLFTDSKNRIWIASESDKLSYYNPTSDDFFTVPIGDGTYTGHGTNVIQDGLGKVWFSTNKGDLFKIEEGNGKYKASKVALPFKGDILDLLYFDSHIWVNTRNGGIWRIDCSTNRAELFDNRIFQETYSLTKHEDQVYVSTPEGIFSIDKELEIRNLYEGSLGEVSNFVIDYKNNIWVGLYNSGMLLLEKTLSGNYEIKTKYTAANYLSTNRINDLLIDSFDILWIGTSGGGAHYIDLRTKPFSLIDKENSELPDNYITAITGDAENLWIGTRSGLLHYYERNKASYVLTNGHISSLYLDDNGLLWVGKRFNGLWLYENGKLVKSYKETDDGLPSNEVIGVSEDHLGRLWAITFDNGAVIFDNKGDAFTHLNESNFLPTNNLSYLYFDTELPNTCWISSIDHGLLKLTYNDSTINSVTNYTFDRNDSTSLGSNYVWPILRSSSGNLWVGTLGGGLNKMIEDTDKPYFKRYTMRDGLPDNDVESLLEDGTGNLWIGGRGLTRFVPEEEEFDHFDFNDGLQSNSFKIGSAFKNTEGILYFGGIEGLNYFNPRLINANPYPPKLIFNGLEILNNPVKIGAAFNDRIVLTKALSYKDRLEFKHNENEFSIELLAIHYSNPQKNDYAYKLEGYSEDWVHVNADERKITFSNLPPGDYIFKAKAANRDGLWSDVKSLDIEILPPWWGTWWANIVYVLLFIFALYLYRMFVNRKSVLEKNLAIAEKEMSLNKEKIKFFTNISHEIRTPLTLINGQLEDIQEAESEQDRYGGKLMAIRANVNRLLNLTSLLLDFRKMESGNLKLSAAEGNFSNYSKEIYSFFLSLAEKKNIDYTYTSDPKNIRLTFDRNNFEIIITNLISNAFKYTKPGGTIAMQLRAIGDDKKPAVFGKVDSTERLINNYLELSIQDDGIGMSNKELEKIFDRYYQAKNLNTLSIQGTGIGLSLVKGLVELHKGEIEVESAENMGSKFIIKVPFGQKHFKEEFLFKDFKKSDHRSYYMENLHSDRDPTIKNQRPENFKKRILIVEDNPEIRDYLSEHFKSSFNVLQAPDGKKGLKQAKKYIPDIIISDVMMPEMDGLEMLKNLKNDPDLSYIPVILLTARTANLYEFKGIDIGAQDYITKPFSIKILKRKVDNILSAREKYKEYYQNRMVNEPSSVSLPNSEQKFLDDITNIVLENLINENFSVKMLVREMGMSQSSCYKRLKELTGRSAVQFIRDVRLNRAGELLKEDWYNISEVAIMVGINDAQYFREKFKEHFGCNPSELHTRP